jgi:hypothetical protein
VVVREARVGATSVFSGGLLSSVGELVVGVDDKLPERDWNADS